MSLYNKTLGRFGEVTAYNLLKKEGYHIITTNYRTRYGEIDVIAKKADTISFIEVKTRSDRSKGYPHEAITRSKVARIKSVATTFLLKYGYNNHKFCIGVISIIMNGEDGEIIKFYRNIEL